MSSTGPVAGNGGRVHWLQLFCLLTDSEMSPGGLSCLRRRRSPLAVREARIAGFAPAVDDRVGCEIDGHRDHSVVVRREGIVWRSPART